MRPFSFKLLGGVFFYLLLAVPAFVFNFQGLWLVFFLASLVIILGLLSLFQTQAKYQLKPKSLLILEQGTRSKVSVDLSPSPLSVFWQWSVTRAGGQVLDQTFFYRGGNRLLQWEEEVEARGPLFARGIQVSGLSFFLLQEHKQRVDPCQIGWGLPLFHPDVHHFANWYQEKIQDKAFQPSYQQKQVRLYQPGDPLKQVHWKLSSKQEDLLVKEYQAQEAKPGPLYLIGLDGPDFEEMVSLAYSYYLTYQAPVYLLGCGYSLQDPVVLEDFAQVQALKPQDLPEKISLPDQGLVLWSGTEDPDFLAERGKTLVLGPQDWQSLKEAWYEG